MVRTCVRAEGPETPLTAQGTPHARLRRALATGNSLIARATAAEAGRIDLADGLALCLLLLEREPERFGAWAARWHAAWVRAAGGVEEAEAAFVLSALTALRGPARLAAARALSEVCEVRGPRGAVRVLDEWVAERDGVARRPGGA
jgi:hypothetical protein